MVVLFLMENIHNISEFENNEMILQFEIKDMMSKHITWRYKPGKHNIGPAGQMWTSEAFIMAHYAQNFII